MSTTTITQPVRLRSSDLSVTVSDIALLKGDWEVAFTDFPPPGYSAVAQMLDGWWGHTLLRSMPLELLRRKLCRALYGVAPDRRTEKRWQRQVDQLIADALNTGEVQLIRGDGRR